MMVSSLEENFVYFTQDIVLFLGWCVIRLNLVQACTEVLSRQVKFFPCDLELIVVKTFTA